MPGSSRPSGPRRAARSAARLRRRGCRSTHPHACGDVQQCARRAPSSSAPAPQTSTMEPPELWQTAGGCERSSPSGPRRRAAYLRVSRRGGTPSWRRTGALLLHEHDSTAGMREHRHWTEDRQLLVPPVAARAELLAGGDGRLVRRCDGVDCARPFDDRTRAHRRRWCSMAPCGNRAEARNHRRRRARRSARSTSGPVAAQVRSGISGAASSRSRNARARPAIWSACSSSAKWPASSRCTSASGTSRW